jgi:SAM-dependent methyltransferase
VPIEGWDFGWLDGRAVEERPTWRYFDRVAERTGDVSTLLEVQAGVGSMIGRLASLPRLAVATEGLPASVAIAAPRLRSTGVHLVVTSQTRQALPFAAGAFELVISRHPIEVWWREIARVLRPGGTYFAQHVGPHSLRSLSEFLMGPLPDASNRDTELERRARPSRRTRGAGHASRASVHGVLRHRRGRVLPSRRALDRPRLHRAEVSRRATRTARDHRASRSVRDERQQNPRRSDKAMLICSRTPAPWVVCDRAHEEGRVGRTPRCQQGAHSPMRVSAATPRPKPVR